MFLEKIRIDSGLGLWYGIVCFLGRKKKRQITRFGGLTMDEATKFLLRRPGCEIALIRPIANKALRCLGTYAGVDDRPVGAWQLQG